MKKLIWFNICVFIFCADSFAQCGSGTPLYTVDLSGSPDSIWISPSVKRADTCCGSSGCIEFIITLDTFAEAISLDIYSGAVPAGALYYNVNCGGNISIGTPICLSGTGPHKITFCKPGGNKNEYRISSIPKPNSGKDITVREGCSGMLHVEELIDSTITWQSVNNNSTYNSYLSCTSGCDTTYADCKGSCPSYADYVACGLPTSACNNTSVCDTVRVYFVNPMMVSISPDTATICYNDSTITLTANVSGGKTPYTYLWSNGATTKSITVKAGTYIIKVNDSTNCTSEYDTVIVTKQSQQIFVNAGNDTAICSNGKVYLNGKIQGTTIGQWTGGAGTYSPNADSLNTVYTPSSSELTLGKVSLILVSGGATTCPGTKDTVNITIYKVPAPSIKGLDSVCQYKTSELYYTAKVNGNSYSWTAVGGAIASGGGTDSITINWGASGYDTIKVTETNAIGCKTISVKIIKVIAKPAPSISGNDTACENTSNISYSTTSNSGDTYLWTISGGNITSGKNSNIVKVNWGTKGTGILTLKETNASGCDTTIIDTVIIIAAPIAIINGNLNVCENTSKSYTTTKAASNIYLWTVTGGTISYGAGTDSIRVSWGTKGIGTIKIKITNASGCSSTLLDTVNINPDPQINGQKSDSVCEYSNSNKYYTSSNSGSTYKWKVKYGSIISGATSDTVIIKWGAKGIDSLFLTETNSFGCTTTVSKAVQVFALPKPVITGRDTICEYTPNINYNNSLNAGSIYLWNITGGSFLSRSDSNAVAVRWSNNGSGSLSVKETNAGGCDTTVSKSIVIHQRPAPVISGSDSVCQYDKGKAYTTKKNIGNSYQWTVSGGNIIKGAGTDSITVNWGGSGTGSVSVKESNIFLCDSTVSINIIINQKPTPSISGLTAVCENDTQVYATKLISGDTYNWSITGGKIYNGNNTNTVKVLWGNGSSGFISVKEINAVGCDTTITQNIAINAKPKPVISGLQNVCQYDTAISYSVNNVSGDTFQWVVTGGSIISGNNSSSIKVNWGSTGKGTVKITQTNSLGCDTSVSIILNIDPKPKPYIIGNDSTCEYSTGNTYQTKYTLGNKYQWVVNGGTIIGKNDSNIVTVDWGINTASASVQVKETNTLGCDSSSTLNINIIAPPVPLISGKGSICQYKTGINYSTTSHAGNIYNWVVNGGTIVSGNGTNSIVVDWGLSGSGTLQVTETNSLGCDSSVLKMIAILAKPTPVIIGSSSLCEHINASEYSISSNKGDTILWTVNGGTISKGQGTDSVIINWGNAGTGSLSVKVTNAQGCDTFVSKNIAINPLPKPYILGKDSVCRFTVNEIYSTASNNGNTYKWSSNGGVCSPSNTNTVGVSWGKEGTGKVYVIETTKLGCDTSVTKKVIIIPRPTPTITGKDSVCEYTTRTNYSVNPETGTTSKWSVTGGSIIGNDTGIDIQIDWKGKGVGLVSVRQVNVLGCDTTIQKTVQIISKPVPKINGPVHVCENTSGYIYTTPNILGYIYTWNITGGIIDSNNQNTIKVSWGLKGTGTLALQEINSLGCDSTISIDISIENLKTSIDVNPIYGCVSSPVYFRCDPDSNVVSFKWDLGDTTFSIKKQPMHQYKHAGIFDIKLISKSNIGCSDTAYSKLEVYDNPIADFDIIFPTQEKIIYNLEDKLVILDKSINAVSYFWDFGDGTTSNKSIPDHIYAKPGDYKIKLIVFNDYGCSDSIVKTIKIGAHVRLFIPNTFTPTRDGLNDSFSAVTSNIVELNITIYDRWGEKIYESNDVNFKWDGSYRNKPIANDVFMYMIQAVDVFNIGVVRTGTVTILRQ